MKTPKVVSFIETECACFSISNRRWTQLMEGATRANKKTINKLVKKHIPELYEGLCLKFYNPYDYLKTSTHLILVHSSIEYFLKYEN